MASLKRHLFKNLTDFSELMAGDVTLMRDMVLKVSLLYLLSLLSN